MENTAYGGALPEYEEFITDRDVAYYLSLVGSGARSDYQSYPGYDLARFALGERKYQAYARGVEAYYDTLRQIGVMQAGETYADTVARIAGEPFYAGVAVEWQELTAPEPAPAPTEPEPVKEETKMINSSTLGNLDAASLAFLATFGGNAGILALQEADILPEDVTIDDFKTVLVQETALDQGLLPRKDQIAQGIALAETNGLRTAPEIIIGAPEMARIAPKTVEYVLPIATDVYRELAADSPYASIPALLDGNYGVVSQEIEVRHFQGSPSDIQPAEDAPKVQSQGKKKLPFELIAGIAIVAVAAGLLIFGGKR